MEMRLEILSINLEMAVPAAIDDLQKRGGPTEEMVESLRELPPLSEAMSISLPTTKQEFARLVDALAILSFQPGGVRAFGLKFDGTRPPFHAPQREDE